MSKVLTSSVIPAPIEKVWSRIRDFNGMPEWHPLVADSHIEGGKPSDSIGCVRNFNLAGDGGNIREQLLALSDSDHSFTYCILESPMSLKNYVAALQLRPVTKGDQTYGEWTAAFDCQPEDEAGLVEMIGNDVFQGGFDSLKKYFGG